MMAPEQHVRVMAGACTHRTPGPLITVHACTV
jgi:hypothetical protein